MALPTTFIASAPAWINSAITTAIAATVAIAIALVVHAIAVRLLSGLLDEFDGVRDIGIARQLSRPLRWALIALALAFAARQVPWIADAWAHVSGLAIPAIIGWLALVLVQIATRAMALRADITTENNLQARRRLTRLTILSRIATFVVIVITIALMLLSIPSVRNVGVTLIASAGLAGLAVGAAAQPALKSLIAGIQMALTEPIRIDDVVIINGEWGRIEDIRTTYVVVKVWDERRLVVPTSKFMEDTFQNWTRESSELLGTVFLYLDPATHIAPVREEAERQIRAHTNWDGRVAGVQVTDTTASAMEVRLLMSARDAGLLFDLRCAVREAMLDWLRREMPQAIARKRLEMERKTDTIEAG
ncbi:mechanosensitive ion channel family protein [Novosphingobium sp. ZN18A2]|uniref:mechanosensitive ion channel family protein n=1 Tax=Novosphingobium sp. ZN18A2 TaxID=3079861 RepID=UPI0030D19F0A